MATCIFNAKLNRTSRFFTFGASARMLDFRQIQLRFRRTRARFGFAWLTIPFVPRATGIQGKSL